jgi:excisionase family DNA binding protein
MSAVADRATLSVKEAGQVLGISRDLAYQAASSGQLPTIRVGRRILVPIAALDRMLSAEPSRDESNS